MWSDDNFLSLIKENHKQSILNSKNIEDFECVVYWIHKKADLFIQDQGYVGVSTSIKSRFKQHTYSKLSTTVSRAISKYDDELSWIFIYAGTVAQCLQLEQFLRPTGYIGWNMSPGGAHHHNHSVWTKEQIGLKHRGKIVSQETRQLIREYNTGKKLSPETRAKMKNRVPPNRKQTITPLGTFPSHKSAAEHYKISSTAVRYRCINQVDGFHYV